MKQILTLIMAFVPSFLLLAQDTQESQGQIKSYGILDIYNDHAGQNNVSVMYQAYVPFASDRWAMSFWFGMRDLLPWNWGYGFTTIESHLFLLKNFNLVEGGRIEFGLGFGVNSMVLSEDRGGKPWVHSVFSRYMGKHISAFVVLAQSYAFEDPFFYRGAITMATQKNLLYSWKFSLGMYGEHKACHGPMLLLGNPEYATFFYLVGGWNTELDQPGLVIGCINKGLITQTTQRNKRPVP